MSADRVAAAMTASPRVAHLPSEQRAYASDDTPLPLFSGQTNSQPSTVADMLRLLDVPEGAGVLDVGAGSGWTTAILAHLVGPGGSVLGVELNPELAAWGAENVTASGRSWARLEAARPGILGAPDAAPFDRILVSAMAGRIPEQLIDQLRPGGVMVIPVDGRMVRLTRQHTRQDPFGRHADRGHSPLRIEKFGHYRFVPLITD